ncbi:MAG: thiamine phosphate synthase [Candidatus Tantalella remota]|nr:thiamine phosphate synthase [Candidatus Tantalella remota]
MDKIINNSLYLVTGTEYSKGRDTLEVTEKAVLGGIDILQMREKDMSPEELLDLGLALKKLCSENNVTFIVNDDPHLAKELDADGVHLGQEDLLRYSVERTREIVGVNKIIGVSTHSVEQFRAACEKDCDYIAFGPVFHTLTKNYTIGIGDVEEVLSVAAKPVVFIGGINADNVGSVLDKGAKNIAVIRAVAQAEDVTAAACRIKDIMSGGRDDT